MENSSLSRTLPDSPIAFVPEAFRPGPSAAVLAGGLGIILVIVLAGLVLLIATHAGDLAALRRPADLVPFGLGLQAAIDAGVAVYLLLVLPWLAKTTLAGLGFRTPHAADIGFAIAGALAMIVVVNGMGSLIDSALHTKHEQEAVKIFLGVHDPLLKAFIALLAVVVAPVAEELAFRVFIFNAARRYGGFWLGAVVSGIMFGLAHVDKYALVPLIFGGIILCAVYNKTRNAYMSMITHGIFNAVSIVVLFFLPQLAH